MVAKVVSPVPSRETWPCQYCRAECISYQYLKLHQLTTCRHLLKRPYTRSVIEGARE